MSKVYAIKNKNSNFTNLISSIYIDENVAVHMCNKLKEKYENNYQQELIELLSFDLLDYDVLTNDLAQNSIENIFVVLNKTNTSYRRQNGIVGFFVIEENAKQAVRDMNRKSQSKYNNIYYKPVRVADLQIENRDTSRVHEIMSIQSQKMRV